MISAVGLTERTLATLAFDAGEIGRVDLVDDDHVGDAAG